MAKAIGLTGIVYGKRKKKIKKYKVCDFLK